MEGATPNRSEAPFKFHGMHTVISPNTEIGVFQLTALGRHEVPLHSRRACPDFLSFESTRYGFELDLPTRERDFDLDHLPTIPAPSNCSPSGRSRLPGREAVFQGSSPIRP